MANHKISFNDNPITNPKKCEDIFNRQFSEHPKVQNRNMRITLRKFERPKSPTDIDIHFSPDIKQSKTLRL